MLEGGPIPPLTALAPGEAGGTPWADLATTADLLAAAGVPEACRSDTRPAFAWAAQLPAPAAIMPHGMVEMAAGRDAGGCRVRLVRYGMDCYGYALLAAGQVDLVIEAGLQAYDVQAPIAVMAASAEDALAWHDTLAQRAGLAIRRHAEPETMLSASAKDGTSLRVRIRPADHGMSAVDLVYWKVS